MMGRCAAWRAQRPVIRVLPALRTGSQGCRKEVSRTKAFSGVPAPILPNRLDTGPHAPRERNVPLVRDEPPLSRVGRDWSSPASRGACRGRRPVGMSAEVELFTLLSNSRFHASRACELDTSGRELVRRQLALSRQTPETPQGCHLVGFRGLAALEPEQGLADCAQASRKRVSNAWGTDTRLKLKNWGRAKILKGDSYISSNLLRETSGSQLWGAPPRSLEGQVGAGFDMS